MNKKLFLVFVYASSALYAMEKKYPSSTSEELSLFAQLAHACGLNQEKIPTLVEKIEPDGELVLNPETEESVTQTIEQAKYLCLNGSALPKLLISGAPGTGKKLTALKIAQSCGCESLDFDMSRLLGLTPAEAERQLNELFHFLTTKELARHSRINLSLAQPSRLEPARLEKIQDFFAHLLQNKKKKKFVLILDDAEVIFSNRRFMKLFWSVLSFAAIPHDNLMIIALTNAPNQIDQDFFNIFDAHIAIPLPGLDQRKKLVELFINRLIYDSHSNQLALKIEHGIEPKLATALDGFSPRQMFMFIVQLKNAAFMAPDQMISATLANKLLKERR